MSQLISRIPLTIANGASLSDAGNLSGRTPSVIMMSAAWTAAGLSFQGSHDNTTFYDLFDDDGTEIVIPTAAARRIPLSSSYLTDHKFIKARSGTSGTPINQGAERIIYIEVWE